jgi:NTP pyrophosphatase (non-canonical NTP hydrolase)
MNSEGIITEALRKASYDGTLTENISDIAKALATELDSRELTFAALRRANKLRLPLFKNRHGEPAHSERDGSDWNYAQWCNAMTGEVGEAANLIKKLDRGDLTFDEARPLIANELADVQTYLDLLAMQFGIDLGEATREKFNEVSDRVQCDVKL